MCDNRFLFGLEQVLNEFAYAPEMRENIVEMGANLFVRLCGIKTSDLHFLHR